MKKPYIAFLAAALAALFTVHGVQAQTDRSYGIIRSALMGLHYEVKAGINIGGASPIPLPREIRKIDSYSPTLCVSIEADVVKWLGEKEKWGLMLGLRMENKGMETHARVKNYSMAYFGDRGEIVEGNWTGMVRTKYRTTLFTIPVLATYKVNNRFRLQFGPYVSFQSSGDFSGHVYEGYLRHNGPTGEKVVFEGNNRAYYDFSDDLRTVQAGLQAGVNWKAFRHLMVSADLTWGLSDIFRPEFKTITFDMYPIYLNIGFGYAF